MPNYQDPLGESFMSLAPSGDQLQLITTRAHVTAKLENKFDRQTKAGRNFGRVKFLGAELAKFDVFFVVLPEEEEDFWRDMAPLMRRKGRNGVSPPVDVLNLQINRHGIETVTIVSSEVGPPSAREGRMIRLQLEEWSPKPVEPKKDKAAKGNIDPLDINAGNAVPVEVSNQG